MYSFTSCGKLKIIDFGNAISVNRSQSVQGSFTLTGGHFTHFILSCHLSLLIFFPSSLPIGNVGSVRYMAPEVAQYDPYSEKVDVFSLSIIMWQLLSGSRPYPTVPDEDVLSRVCALCERPDITCALNRSLDARMTYQLRNIISSCWHANPWERMDIIDIFHDLRSIYSALKRLENKKACKVPVLLRSQTIK
jgi:serine/threonine protein kinase